MALKVAYILLVLSMVVTLPMVNDELDEHTRKLMELRAEEIAQRQLALLKSLEQKTQQESITSWKDLLLASWQHWQLWEAVGALVLLFGLFRRLRKRSRQSESGREEETWEEETCSSREEEEEASDREDYDDEGHLFRIFAKPVHGAKKSMAYKCRVVVELMSDLLGVLQARLANSFFVVLEPAIGVGSAFEGWGHDAVYRLLVPLKPPREHTFHLELGSAEKMPSTNHVRVQLQCTCRKDQGVEDMLCFVHQPEEALRRSNLLSDLCTSFYLDVQKIARWFQTLVSSVWGEMSRWRQYSMTVLPSCRSCKLQLTNASGRSLFVEVIFGVQQGDSDIFLSSQATEAIFTLGTTWAESFAVAEAKFFRHVAKQAPQDSFHLKWLQLCAYILEGTSLSSYALKTTVMHLLNTLPPESWTGREFFVRLQDVIWYLRDCLEEKRLDHFFLGNENVPQDITLPPAFQAAEPPNLFQRLVQDPAAHAKALCELEEAQARLTGLLFYGL